MDAENCDETGRARTTDSRWIAVAANSQYVVRAVPTQITIYDVRRGARWTWRIACRKSKTQPRPLLAVSPTGLRLLAVSSGSQITLFNLTDGNASNVLKANGRMVTTLSFSARDAQTFAAATLDGSISIWNRDFPYHPVYQIDQTFGRCYSLALHHSRSNIIAAIFRTSVCLWRCQSSGPLLVYAFELASNVRLEWRTHLENQLVGVSADGSTYVWDFDEMLSKHSQLDTNDANSSGDENELDEFGGRFPTTPTTCHLNHPSDESRCIGANGIASLDRSRKAIAFYAYNSHANIWREVWTRRTQNDVGTFSFCREGQTVEICISDSAGEEVSRYAIPQSVLNAVGWLIDSDPLPPDSIPEMEATVGADKMHPRFSSRTSTKQQISTRLLPSTLEGKDARQQVASSHSKTSGIRKPLPRPLTSNLELPVFDEEDETDSPMPFLSPSIPARRFSSGLDESLEDSLHLPPRASFSSLASTIPEPDDSDSDDETFAVQLNSSGTFLPGGVNVPLPRTCGASFSPNGQLLTFFPLRAKPASIVEKAQEEPSQDTPSSTRVVSFFPRFGNLTEPSKRPERDSGVANNASQINGRESLPQFVIQSASYENMPSWTQSFSPVKALSVGLPGDRKSYVKLQSVDLALGTPQRELLGQYQFVTDSRRYLSDLCLNNAQHAAVAKLNDVSNGWRLLATLFSMTSSESSQMINDILESNAAPGASLSMDACGLEWTIQELFTWAERHADVQTLAWMSRLLLGSPEASLVDGKGSNTERPPHEATAVASDLITVSTPSAVKLLRADSGDLVFIDDSPTKSHGSRTSSTNQSQPTTPHLETGSLTPAFPMPMLSRHGTRVSTSSSVSPEHNRSSFSAAAKTYAQSITDRITSYGTSPPARRAGTSPTNIDLSTSLPNGSLSKSVSFASTIDTAKSSLRSSSFATEVDGYESDRTVEDTSLPRTPKALQDEVDVSENLVDDFFDESAVSGQPSLLPKNLWDTSSIWRSYHADSLRSCDMLIEATEMEKLSQVSYSGHPKSIFPSATAEGQVLPGPKRVTCSICFCLLTAAEHVCPMCLHAAHPGCLEDLIEAVGAEEFSCPTGCGCACAMVADLEYGTDEAEIESEDLDGESIAVSDARRRA